VGVAGGARLSAGAHALDIDALAKIRATGLDCAGHRGAATAAAGWLLLLFAS
jgi:hypothetical protein